MNELFDFEAFPKVPRFYRNWTATEKIDGTNAAIVIRPEPEDRFLACEGAVKTDTGYYGIRAQSRKRFISPGDDNFGFAAWVFGNADELVATLGPGRHFGEWWGLGIQRGYNQRCRRFSLFNTDRWGEMETHPVGDAALGVVPILARHTDPKVACAEAEFKLSMAGSCAAPGWDRPEGIMLWSHAARQMFKYTPFDGDGHKGG